MKRCTIFFMAMMAMNLGGVFAAPKLPEKAMGKPRVFLEENKSYEWSNVVRNKQWGALTSQYWRVYIDRDGVNSYENPSRSSNVEKKNLEFMSAYYVAKIEGDFALLYEEKYVQTNLLISKDAKSIGWVELSKLLMWDICPRTQGQVYQKAVILKDIDAIQDKRDINEVSPRFSSSPSQMNSTGKRATELEFYFIYKMSEEGAALLLTESRIQNENALKRMPRMGWMKRGNFTIWNDRLCYEPNFDNPGSSAQAAIFQREADAQQYKRTGEISGPVLWRDKLPSKRWPAKKTRFPVLKMSDRYNYIANVGTIGSTGGDNDASANAQQVRTEIDRATDKVDVLRQKMAQVNVVFVIDGTSSMKDYYQPVARAIKDAMRHDALRGAHIRFGAVVYRNYADDDLVETKQLSSDAEGVASWLVSRQCHSVGSTHYEAMLYGLTTAVDKMSWSRENANFLIHIGDAGNAKPDSRGCSIDNLATKMAEKEINYIGFQVNHPDNIAYHDFCSQIMEIMVKELKALWGRSVKRKDFIDKDHRLKEVSSAVKGNQIISAAYHYAEVNHTESTTLLKELIERKIAEFNEIALNELSRLQAGVDQMTGDETVGEDKSDRVAKFENIELFLSDRGFTEQDIRALKMKNVVLKIKGYAPRVANDKDVFVPSVFLAKTELDDLINSLASLSRNVSSNRRKDLQRVLQELALSYIGQSAQSNNMTVAEIMEAVSGLQVGTGKLPLADVQLDQIENVNLVTDEMIDNYLSRINKDLEVLKRRATDRSCYFDSPNGIRYYYILMEDMPLQK